jgi:hypothetical protein
MLGNVMKGLVGPRKVDPPSLYRKLMDEKLHDLQETFPRQLPVEGKLSTYLRVSSLGKLCSRREGLQIKMQVATTGMSKPEYEMARSLGQFNHMMLQTDIVPRLAGDRMRGWWKIPGVIEHPDSEGFMWGRHDNGRPVLFTRAEAESHLKTSRIEYVEVSLADHKYFLTGHPDMVMDWTGLDLEGAPDGEEVQEYKFVDKRWWDKVDPLAGGAPDEGYVKQIMAYMWLLNIPNGRIIYFQRGERNPKKGIVEWVIEQDADQIADFKKTVTAYWDDLYASHETGAVSEHQPCPKFDRFPATWCPLRHECFGRNRRKAPPHRKMTPEELMEWNNT